MKRLEFLKSLALLPLFSHSMELKAISQLSDLLDNSERMPLLFLGHGSPMNAIEENEFVLGFRNTARNLPKPKAILCISAHWETNGTYVTAMEQPRTIHDFGGFPQRLFDVQYPAPGSPELARETQQIVTGTHIELDHAWGLDHGAWSVIKHLYPDATIPVIQLSLDRTKPAQYHYELAGELSALRKKGVLIIGSGNIVHNLRMVAWDKLNAGPFAYDWNTEVNDKIKSNILEGNFQELVKYTQLGKAFKLAIPTPEHYLPLLYILGLIDSKDETSIFNDQPVGGSLSMTSFKFH